MPIVARSRRLVVGGAALWIVAAAAYLGSEAIAAAAFLPAYSYAHNYISDLGITVSTTIAGRVVDSPRAALINTAFYVQGGLFLAGAALVALGLRSRRPALFVSFAVLNGAGNALVATVHGGPASAAGGPAWVHSAGALLAIVGGNAAVLAGSKLIADAGGPRPYRAVSIGIGVLGLLSLLMLWVDSLDLLPDAVWERASVYSIIGWQLLSGLVLLTCATRGRPD
jgi:hypothetical protein